MTEHAKLAAVYCRTSKDDKDDPSLSIPQQLEDGKAEAVKLGYVVKARHIYIDPDISGKLPPRQWADSPKAKYRKAFTALIDAIRNNEVSCVIVRKRDRLARNTLYQLLLWQLMQTSGCTRLVCTHEKIDTGDDAAGKLTLTMLAAIAEFELAKTSENIRAAKSYAKRHGLKLCTAVNVFGYYDGENTDVLKDDEQASVVREVFRRYISGQSAASIARWLKAEYPDLKKKHFSEKTKRVWRWRTSSVIKMIRNPHYASYDWVYEERQQDEKKLAEYFKTTQLKESPVWPLIIDKPIWWAAQKRYKANYIAHSPRTIRLFSGLLKCGYCGETLVAYHQYRKDRRDEVCFKCPSKHSSEHPFGMRAEEYERWYGYFYSQRKEECVREDTPSINAKLVELEEARHQLTDFEDMLTTRKWGVDKYERLSRKVEQGIEKLMKSVEIERSALQKAVRLKEWSEMTLDEQREDIRSWCTSIKVYQCYVDFTISGGHVDRFPLLRRRVLQYPTPYNVLVPAGKLVPRMGEFIREGERLIAWRWHPKYLSRYLRYADEKLNPKFTTKICPKCGKEKDLSEFSRNSHSTDGLTSYCKPCNWTALTKYRNREGNKEKKET